MRKTGTSKTTVFNMKNKIRKDKQYRTRDGRPARILATDRKHENYSVIALIGSLDGGFENLESFTIYGKAFVNDIDANDLVEVTPYDDFEIDEPVLVRYTKDDYWTRRHFAGISQNGRPLAWEDGQTSWTCSVPIAWDHCHRPTEAERNEILND